MGSSAEAAQINAILDTVSVICGHRFTHQAVETDCPHVTSACTRTAVLSLLSVSRTAVQPQYSLTVFNSGLCIRSMHCVGSGDQAHLATTLFCRFHTLRITSINDHLDVQSGLLSELR